MKDMKRLILVLAMSVSSLLLAAGQSADTLAAERDSLTAEDTAVTVRYMSYDSLMTCLRGHVRLSNSLSKAMGEQVEKNRGRRTQGYRLRIYFDNSQDARAVSERIVDTFKVHYPEVPVFRIYDNPYFKVTVGEFRSKSDAMRFLEAIRPEYPAVFLVKEFFSTI